MMENTFPYCLILFDYGLVRHLTIFFVRKTKGKMGVKRMGKMGEIIGEEKMGTGRGVKDRGLLRAMIVELI